jgi:hypothetical protein
MQIKFEEALEQIKNNDKSFTNLDLSHNEIDAEGTKDLSSALQVNTSLTELDLSENQIGSEGVKDLSGALIYNTSLTKLDLSKNQIGVEGSKFLENALKKNKCINMLSLSSNNILDEGAKALANGLKENKWVTNVNLDNNNIGNEGAKALANALKENIKLINLNLGNNIIGAAGTKDLSDALIINTSLKELDLSYNLINSDATKDLVGFLKVNKSLTHLKLNGCKIGEEGFKALASALKQNTSLIHINLGSVGPGIEDHFLGWEAIKKALKINYYLLECKGGHEWRVKEYLVRNRNYADCLQPLNEVINKGGLLNDGKIIESCLRDLEKLVPDLHSLRDDKYPVEAYRMLTSLGHACIEGEEATIDALQGLLPSFKHQPFQHLADKSLSLLLSGNFSKILKERNLEQEGLLLSLYGFRNYPSSPELKNFALIALYKLCNKSEFTVQEKQTFEEQTKIVTQRELVSLLEQALNQCEQESVNSCEIDLLKAVLASGNCGDFTLSTVCLSPHFIKIVKEHYPKAASFTTIEHCLLTAANGNSSFLMDITSIPIREIIQQDVVSYSKDLLHNNTKPLIKIIDNLKDTLKNAFSGSLNEPNEVNVNEDISVKSYKTKREPEAVVTGHSVGFFQPEKSQIQPQSEKLDLHAAFIECIGKFCQIPEHEQVDGIRLMSAIIENQELGSLEKIIQLIRLSNLKQLETDSSSSLYYDVKKFYQDMAGLNYESQEAMIHFINSYSEGKSSVSTCQIF